MNAAVPQLEVVALRKRYKDFDAVDGVSFCLARGALLTLLGPSGCGKTTLLRMIAGFVDHSEGDILINGRSVTALRPERRPTAMVFQSYALFPHMTVFENVAFGLRLRKVAKAELRGRVERALDLVRMGAMATRYPSELSGGQQQRVALARCLVIEPDILLLDEPFGALDKHLRDQMQVELRKLQRQLSITMIVVTHDQDEALVLSDFVAVMNAGRVVQFDVPSVVYDQPNSRFVASFMGMSNILRGELESSWTERVFRLVDGGRVPVASSANGADAREIAIRPENLSLVPPGSPAACFEGSVTFATMVGGRTVYEVQMPSATISVEMRRDKTDLAIGSRVGIAVDPEKAVLLSA